MAGKITTALIILNAVALLANVRWFYIYRANRRVRRRSERREVCVRQVSRCVAELPTVPELALLWRPIWEKSDVLDIRDQKLAAIASLSAARPEDVRGLLAATHDVVNAVNDLCEWVDDDLIGVRDIRRWCTTDQVRLLGILPLLEPVIWYRSVVQNMGRWGYRPLLLSAKLSRLLKPTTWQLAYGPVLAELPRFPVPARSSLWRVRARLAGAWIRSPGMTTFNKRRQNRQATRLRANLRNSGVSIAEPATVRRTVSW